MKSVNDQPPAADGSSDNPPDAKSVNIKDRNSPRVENAVNTGANPIEGTEKLSVDGSMEGGSDSAPAEKTNCELPQSLELGGSTPGSQRKGLRVTFPEDKIVSGYMDPPTPWNDASQCSTDELVAAYLGACEKIGVKVNTRLLSQLQVITNFDDRNETLTLKNENLDARHCETLEEVFRRVQFRTIDLEATKLDEEGAVTIFDMIEYYESCLKLNISYSKNLGQRGWQACSRMIRKTPCLENLEARGSTLSDFVMPFLGRSLRVSSSLTSLHLEFTVTSGKPLQILVAALKVNETLKELYLADNKLMPSDGIQLGSLLKYNQTLHLLDLRNNHLQDTGFQHICEGIWEQGKSSGLNTLVIWNNQLSYQAMNHLSKALLNNTSLETLNLGHNNLTNEGMHRLKESLLKNKSLLRIGLQASKVTCEGAVALAEFVAESSKLLRLDLRENEIKTGGLMALSLALKVSQSVTRIDLDKEPKKESGMKDYADQQRRLLGDITNYMQRNRILARQREEDEMSQENDRDATVPAAPAACELERKEEVCQEETKEDCEGSDPVVVASKEESIEEKKEPLLWTDNSPRLRMNLTLELTTRCQMLESPDFVPESEMPAATPPSEDAVALPGDAARSTKRKIMIDIPPSPMVSSQGKTVLIPVFEAPLSPSLDDMTVLCTVVKPEDVRLTFDSSSKSSGSLDDSISSTSDADELASLSSSLDESSLSPDNSFILPCGSEVFCSSLSTAKEAYSSHVLTNSSSFPVGNSHSGVQGKRSSLKMTRPKLRFQVSKASLSHKPSGRRGSGSHKTLSIVSDVLPNSSSEHSRVEAGTSLFLMTSTNTFQPLNVGCGGEFHGDRIFSSNSSKTSVDISAKDTASTNSKVESLTEDSVTISGSARAPPCENQPVSKGEGDDRQQNSLNSHRLQVNVKDAELLGHFLLQSKGSAESSDFSGKGEEGIDVMAVLLSGGQKQQDNINADDTIPRHEDVMAKNSGNSARTSSAAAYFHQENPNIVDVDAQDFSFYKSEVGGIDFDISEPRNGAVFVEKTSSSSVSNGLVIGFPQNTVEMANVVDDVRRMHLEKTSSSTDDHSNDEKLIV